MLVKVPPNTNGCLILLIRTTFLHSYHTLKAALKFTHDVLPFGIAQPVKEMADRALMLLFNNFCL